MRGESANRAHFVCKAGSRLLRILLIESARKLSGKDGKLNRFYLHLCGRRGRPKAKVAIARKLLVRARIVAHSADRFWNPPPTLIIVDETRADSNLDSSPQSLY